MNEERKELEGKEQEVEMKKVDNDRKEEKSNDGNSKEDSTEEKNTSDIDGTEEGKIAENYGIDPMDEEKDEASYMQQTADANGIKIENEKVIPFEEGTENGLVLTIEVNLVKIESNEVDQDGIQELDVMEKDVPPQSQRGADGDKLATCIRLWQFSFYSIFISFLCFRSEVKTINSEDVEQ